MNKAQWAHAPPPTSRWGHRKSTVTGVPANAFTLNINSTIKNTSIKVDFLKEYRLNRKFLRFSKYFVKFSSVFFKYFLI